MPSNPSESLPDPQTMSYEQAIAELEAINMGIERGDMSLEDSLAAYRRGVALAKRCSAILETAEQEVKKITPGEDNVSEA